MVHKTVLEALERLLFSVFKKTVEISSLLETAKEELRYAESHGEKSRTCDAVQGLAEEYFKFKQDVRNGKLGKTAKFWIQYADLIWNILHLQRATKTNDLDLHISSFEKMCPLFFSMDHQNYAHYLTCYILLLLNLDISHPGAKDLLKKRGFSVGRSTFPASRVPIDQMIEHCNKDAKGNGGVVGISQNNSAYQRWCITRHRRASFVSLLKEQLGVNSKDNPHKDNMKSEMKKSDKKVRAVMQSFKGFQNPFEMTGEDSPLVSLSSGLQASKQVEDDMLTLQEVGRKQHQSFIKERLVTKSTSFHAPIKRNRKQNFASLSKTTSLKTSQKQELKLKAQRNVFGQLLMLSEKHHLDLQKVMEYPLGPVPWSLATADGMPIKTDKAALMTKLEEESSYKYPEKERDHVHVIDGNALFHNLTQIPDTFGELAKDIFKRLPKGKRLHFLTDNYHDMSIKASERLKRGESNALLLAGPSMKTPKKEKHKDGWKEFLRNDKNKKQFIQFLLSEWEKDEYAESLLNRQIYFAYDHITCVLY